MAAHSQTHRDDADDDDDDEDEDEDEDEGEDEGEDDAASMGAAAVFVVRSSTTMATGELPTTMVMMIRSQSRMKIKQTKVKYAPPLTFLLFG